MDAVCSYTYVCVCARAHDEWIYRLQRRVLKECAKNLLAAQRTVRVSKQRMRTHTRINLSAGQNLLPMLFMLVNKSSLTSKHRDSRRSNASLQLMLRVYCALRS